MATSTCNRSRARERLRRSICLLRSSTERSKHKRPKRSGRLPQRVTVPGDTADRLTVDDPLADEERVTRAPGADCRRSPNGSRRFCCHFKEYDDLTVVGEASTGEQALQLVGTLMPDVVIMDMHMPGWNGAETTSRILKEHPSTMSSDCPFKPIHTSPNPCWRPGPPHSYRKNLNNELYSRIQSAVRPMTPLSLATSPLSV